MTTYRQLFAIGEFRVLFLTRCFVIGGVSVSGLALGTIMYRTTGSPLLTGLALFGGPLVQLVTSHFLLASSDLLRPRSAMVLVGVTSAATDLLQVVPRLPWGARLGLLAAGYVAVAATSGTVMALLSDIVPREAFLLGRATMNVAVGSMQIVGNALGAVLLVVLTANHLFLLSAAITLVAVVIARLGLADHPPRATGAVVARTRAVNRLLLGSPVLRPVYLAMWVPNGLIVGCEALYIPYAGGRAGWLFAAAAAGMLAGDVVVGRFVPPVVRDRLVEPLRWLLAAPYLSFFLAPAVAVAAPTVFVASFGYAAGLPLQERLVRHTDAGHRGQVFGLAGTGMMVMQAVGAIVAGSIAGRLGEPSRVIGLLAVLSLLVTVTLTPSLQHSRLAEPADQPYAP